MSDPANTNVLDLAKRRAAKAQREATSKALSPLAEVETYALQITRTAEGAVLLGFPGQPMPTDADSLRRIATELEQAGHTLHRLATSIDGEKQRAVCVWICTDGQPTLWMHEDMSGEQVVDWLDETFEMVKQDAIDHARRAP